jgi:hypothetical protein
MRVIVAGSRKINDIETVFGAIKESGFNVTTVISGGARGVDSIGEHYGIHNNIPVDRFIPDWRGLGKSAGYIRNVQMADNADALVAVWDGVSNGTAHMIKAAASRGLKVFIYRTDKL